MAKITHCILSPMPFAFIGTDNSRLSSDGESDICLGGYLDLNGSQQVLQTGDILRLTDLNIPLDVELIVGQDPLTTGFQNDIGGQWAAMIPYLSLQTGSFDPANLLTNNYCLRFDKESWWENSPTYATTFDMTDGAFNPIEIHLTNVVTSSGQNSDPVTDNIPTCTKLEDNWFRFGLGVGNGGQGRYITTPPGVASQAVICAEISADQMIVTNEDGSNQFTGNNLCTGTTSQNTIFGGTGANNTQIVSGFVTWDIPFWVGQQPQHTQIWNNGGNSGIFLWLDSERTGVSCDQITMNYRSGTGNGVGNAYWTNYSRIEVYLDGSLLYTDTTPPVGVTTGGVNSIDQFTYTLPGLGFHTLTTEADWTNNQGTTGGTYINEKYILVKGY